MSIERLGYYAFYGSLRLGMENHLAFADTVSYLRTVNLTGYRMYSLGEYPYVVQTHDPDDVIIADLFYIDSPATEQMIYEMEIDAGYIRCPILIEGNKFGIYVFPSSMPGDEYLPGGDWVSNAAGRAF
jgi:gamma-glutamylcyclotransferase (GGCT)/AIG2-like uncharacterized protein YtfP